MGGLGFPVWHDIAINIKKMTEIKKRPLKWLFTRLCLQSKIVLTMTGLLILCGAVGFFLLEFNNPETMGDMNLLSVGDDKNGGICDSSARRLKRKFEAFGLYAYVHRRISGGYGRRR